MVDEHVCYEGRLVPKKHFRVFIYDAKGEQLLVESFEDYEFYLSTGEWFGKKSDIPQKEQSKKGRK